MRNRSETIYALNEEEFKLKMNKNEIMQKKQKKSKLSILAEKIKKDDDNLACNKTFIIEERPLTMLEQEKLEEETLIITIENLASSLRNNDEEEFIRNLCVLNKSNGNKYSNTNHFKRTTAPNFFEKININMVKSNMSCNLDNCSTNASNTFLLLSQNLEVAEEKIKIMVLGEKHVGKTNLISIMTNNHISNTGYLPTESLEIKHKMMNILGKYIKVEFWDTSLSILKSPIINTYYNICDVFLIVCNPNDSKSINFVESQIENIITRRVSTEIPNILITLNDYEKSIKYPFHKNIDHFKSIFSRKFNLSHNLDITQTSLINSHLIDFLINVSLDKGKKQTQGLNINHKKLKNYKQ